MKRNLLVVSLGLLIFVTAARAARAQGAPGVRIGISGGADFPVQDQKDVYKTGWNGTLVIPINFGTAPVGLRVDGSYHELQTKSDVQSFFVGTGKTRIISGTADVVLGPKALPVEPYLLGGVGVYDLRFRGQEVDTGNVFSDTTTRFGWNAGAGVAFRMGDASSSRFFLEARYTSVSTSADRFSNSVKTGGTRFTLVPVNVGFIF
jgi:opacity protein-like surface antigen